MKILFAPDPTPELEIMKQMLKGERQIYFAIFTCAGSSGIDDAMLTLARSGVKIKGVLYPGQARQKWAAPRRLAHPNIELYLPKKAGVFADFRKLHHKLMVIDERIVVAGGFNYTTPANEYNDEQLRHGLGTQRGRRDRGPGRSSRELALHMKAEIQRIIESANSTCRPERRRLRPCRP